MNQDLAPEHEFFEVALTHAFELGPFCLLLVVWPGYSLARQNPSERERGWAHVEKHVRQRVPPGAPVTRVSPGIVASILHLPWSEAHDTAAAILDGIAKESVLVVPDLEGEDFLLRASAALGESSKWPNPARLSLHTMYRACRSPLGMVEPMKALGFVKPVDAE